MKTEGQLTAIATVKHNVRWTSEMEDRPVDLWQQNKCLYSVSCKIHHIRTDEENSWRTIATPVDVPPASLN